MKRIVLIFLSAVLALSFLACTPAESGSGNNGDDNTKTESKYAFVAEKANNYKVKIDADMADVLKALGEPLSYFEAASCAFDGLDKTYTYAGYKVLTRPDGKKDYVNSVQLTDDSVKTPEGAYLGMTPDAVKGIYGTPNEETETLLSYTDGNTSLIFVLKDAKVISIEYLPA